MPLELIGAPQGLVVSVADAKTYMRVDHSDDDELIEAFIDAVTAQIEGRYGTLGRAIRLQTWDYVLECFPDRCRDQSIELPLPPLIDVITVSYTDAAGDVQTFETGEFEVDINSVPGRVRPVNGGYWPIANLYQYDAVRIRFLAGYIPEDVPANIKLAIKIMVEDLYENRETVSPQNVNKFDIPMAAERLLNQFRVHQFA